MKQIDFNNIPDVPIRSRPMTPEEAAEVSRIIALEKLRIAKEKEQRELAEKKAEKK